MAKLMSKVGFGERRSACGSGVVCLLPLLLCVWLSACSFSKNYSENLKPLQVVDYVTETNRVLKRQAYFGDGRSNVIALTDVAEDGFLPYGDEDGLVDQVSLQIYERNLLLDFNIRNGDVYQAFLSAQGEKKYRAMERRVARILTEKFVKQNNYLWTASSKMHYEIILKNIDAPGAAVDLAVDGQAGRVERGVMRRINGVYILLAEIKQIGDGDTGLDFAVVQVGNQSILLKPNQKVRVGIEATAPPDSKLSRREKINYVFVVGDDTVPGELECTLEDIFHSFLVDRPDHDHVSFYRFMRERGKPDFLSAGSAAGFRVVGEQFETPKKGNFVDGMTEQINQGLEEFLDLFRGKKEQTVTLRLDGDEPAGGRAAKKDRKTEGGNSLSPSLSFSKSK